MKIPFWSEICKASESVKVTRAPSNYFGGEFYQKYREADW
jgi:hypothetical protein